MNIESLISNSLEGCARLNDFSQTDFDMGWQRIKENLNKKDRKVAFNLRPLLIVQATCGAALAILLIFSFCLKYGPKNGLSSTSSPTAKPGYIINGPAAGAATPSHTATLDPNQKQANIIIVYVPPKGWDPLKATDEELRKYAYPPRPKDPEEVKNWEKIVRGTWIKPEFGDNAIVEYIED